MITKVVPPLPPLVRVETEIRATAQGFEVWIRQEEEPWHLAGTATSQENAQLFAAAFDVVATGERILPALRYYERYDSHTRMTDDFAAALARARGRGPKVEEGLLPTRPNPGAAR